MKKLLFTMCAVLATSAAAQQSVKATFSPVTIDGKVTQNGMVTINGKRYVSVDALSAAKVTQLQPNSLGIYNFNAKPNTPVKLSGCMNEWLTDGTTRVRATKIDTNSDMRLNMGTYWYVALEVMTSKDSDSIYNVFAPGQQEVTMKNGQVIAPAKDSFSRIVMEDYPLVRGKVGSAYPSFNVPDMSSENPPVKLIMTPAAKAQVKAPWVFDLTCRK